MKKKCNSTRKNGRFTAIFAAVICLCMLFAACKNDPPENNPPSFGTGKVTLGTPNGTELKPAGLTINLNGVSATDPDGDTLTYKWSCKSYNANGNTVTEADGVATGLSIANGQDVSVTLSKAGLYKFVLTASDGKGGVATSNEVSVTVTPYTVEKDVTASFPAFSVATSVNFAVSYSPAIAGGGFDTSDVTYTVYCAELDRTYSGTGLTANISDEYSDGVYTFTQTFKANDGTTISSRDIKILVDFGYFTQLQNTNGTPLVPQSISSMPLHLSKSVSE